MTRALSLSLMIGLAASLSLGADDAPKDTALAGKTRTVKLKAKVSADFSKVMLREAFKELSGELEAQKLGVLGVTFGTGVSANTKIDYKAKDKPLEEVLDEMLKQLDLGYVVVSKPGDRYDGWLRITKGTERGYEASAEPKKDAPVKKEPAKKDDMKKEEMKKDAPKKGPAKKVDPEAEADILLEIAENCFKQKMKSSGITTLEMILKKYPDTKAASSAKVQLEKEKLGK